MTSSENEGSGRDVMQAAVAVLAALALVLSAALVPALSVPFAPLDDENPGNGDPVSISGDGTTPSNALAPGESTNVGGPVNPETLENGTNATHFVVRADRPSYWRTGAFGRYTGQGWERMEDPSVYTGGVPPEGGERTRQEVRVTRSTRALPAAWRPTAVSFSDGTDRTVYVTEQEALQVQRPIPAGTRYEVHSYVRDPDPDRLRRTGRDYPDEVRRYSRVPAETPDRVGRLTDRITADADDPYETAAAIERWLEATKEYRLDVGHDPSEPVADQFIFEMDAGYCEYFATSMVVMLRTQGIPARYVVGYAPGTTAGEDSYRVRAIDAHAWVEVYFEDVGWVRFDPTPSADRVSNERRYLADDGVTSDRRPYVEGSPATAPRDVGADGGSGGPGAIDGNGSGDLAEWDWSGPNEPEPREPPYDVSLDESPVPGMEVTVQVSKDGMPVYGAVVTFNGEPVGRTDRNGEVTATVPYDERLTVEALASWDGDGRVSASGAAGAAGSDSAGGERMAGSAGTADPGTETYDLPTEVTLEVVGAPAEGRTFDVRATIDDVPVRNAVVRFDGDPVARTDDIGEARISVPTDAADPSTLTVERGDVRGSTQVELRDMQIHLLPHTLVPLPGQGATATVTVGDEPVEGASVYLDGEYVGETDEDGELAVTLPDDDDAAFRAEGPYQSTTRTYWGLDLFLGGSIAGLLAVLVGLLVVPAGLLRYRGHAMTEAPTVATSVLGRVAGALRRVGTTVWSLLARVWRFAMRGGVWLSRAAVSTAILLGTTLLSVGRWLVGATASLGVVLRSLAVGTGTWLADASLTDVLSLGPRLLGLAIRGLRVSWLFVLAVVPFTGVALSEVLGTRSGSRSGPGGAGSGADGADDGTGGRRLLSVREAWRRFLQVLGLSGYRTMTPGEIAREAVDRGLPAGPVGTLTDAFRAVEYGGRPDDATLRERVTGAVRALIDPDRGNPSGGDDS